MCLAEPSLFLSAVYSRTTPLQIPPTGHLLPHCCCLLTVGG